MRDNECKIIAIREKVNKVILSCKTEEHWICAGKYVDLAFRKQLELVPRLENEIGTWYYYTKGIVFGNISRTQTNEEK